MSNECCSIRMTIESIGELTEVRVGNSEGHTTRSDARKGFESQTNFKPKSRLASFVCVRAATRMCMRVWLKYRVVEA